MKKQNGFTVLEVLVIIVIVGLLASVGWLVYSRQHKSVAPTATKQHATNDKLAGYDYTLPANWSKLNCNAEDVSLVLLSSNDDKAVDCNDRTNTVLVGQQKFDAPTLPHCMSQDEVNAAKQHKPLEAYACSRLTVDGKLVIKESFDQGTDMDGNRALSISYTFVQTHPLFFTYFATSDGNLPNVATVDQMVRSVRFK